MKSEMRFIKSALEYRPIEDIDIIPKGLRGIYALYMKDGRNYELVYIGMSGREANGRIRNRIYQHKRKKVAEWTHFSYYEVWDNVTEIEIRELEGLFRQLYRFSSSANSLNRQQTHKPLLAVRRRTEKEFGLKRVTKRTLGR